SRSPSQLAVEYAVLGLGKAAVRIEPWTPVGSLAWLKAMAWDLKSNYADEVTRARLSATLPVARINQLYPPYPADVHAPIVAGSSRWCSRSAAAPPVRGSSPSRSRVWTPCPRCSVAARASGPTRGSWPARAPRPASRCWPTTRTCRRPCRASGTRWACTAPRSAPRARSTSRGSPSRGSPGW
ncbi:MAG: penicillin acylase family protein, partial [Rhodoferax sp.]|nr:penicillin acylase family protein [Actinomycetota bacterium]